jgi:hypothetical protein
LVIIGSCCPSYLFCPEKNRAKKGYSLPSGLVGEQGFVFVSVFLFIFSFYTPLTPLTPYDIYFGVVESSISRGELKSAK